MALLCVWLVLSLVFVEFSWNVVRQKSSVVVLVLKKMKGEHKEESSQEIALFRRLSKHVFQSGEFLWFNVVHKMEFNLKYRYN